MTKCDVNNLSSREVTVFYNCHLSGELKQEVNAFPQNNNGRVILPDSFKNDKSVLAVCDGQVNVLNQVGDRV